MTHRCDVLVVGAGTAGVPAAVAAARAGAETILVEKRAFPGGCGVAGMHRHICGLYPNGRETPGEFINEGLIPDICRRLDAAGGGRKSFRIGRVDVLPYEPVRLREVFAELLAGESRICSMFSTEVRNVVIERQRIRHIITDKAEIDPRVVVDCSGDGVVIRSSPDLFSEAPEKERQLAGCTARFSGLGKSDETQAIRVPYALRQASEAGKLPPGLQFTVFASSDTPGEGFCKISLLPGSLRGGTTVDEAVRAVLDCLKNTVPEFHDAVVVEMSPEVMEREGARLKGEYVLTEADVLNGSKFPDGVVRNAWPIETWDQKRGPTYRYLPEGRFYEIPARCLRAVAVENLLCAGRCISVSSGALGSTRAMGACMALGEVAGKEAAEMAQFLKT